MIAWLAVALAGSVQTARLDLPEGHVLRQADLAAAPLPDGASVPAGVVTEAEAVIGRSLRVPVFAGEALRGEYLGEQRAEPTSLVPAGHWLVKAEVKTTADETDLVMLWAGGFCVLSRSVTVVLRDSDLVAVRDADLQRVVTALGPDASVRRADPGLRDCR